MLRLCVLILSMSFLCCHNSKDFSQELRLHKFDQRVINSLPLYDSLRSIIIANYDSFRLSDGKNSFSYLYTFDTLHTDSAYNNKDLPPTVYSKTVQLFGKIGSDNIFGFTLSKDSTIEFLIRNTHLSEYFLDVRERLSWYNNSGRIQSSSFPLKDTILGDNWQYLIWYDKRSKF